MNWLQQQTTLYTNHGDVTGKPRTLRQVLMCDFGRDINALCTLHKLDRNAPDYIKSKKALKATLQGFTPAALLQSRAKDNVIITSRTGLMQLDFDHEQIKDYDIEELKQAMFALPFIAFCSLSCSGDGFFALALIAEPERLEEYAQYCFRVFIDEYNLQLDTGKGSNPAHLRYVSYDSDMLIRENPKPLQIQHYRRKKPLKSSGKVNHHQPFSLSSDGFANSLLKQVQEAGEGCRITTIQKVAYTLGGTGDASLLDAIKKVIKNGKQYEGNEEKYFKCAQDCFNAGKTKPLSNHKQAGQ